MVQRMVITHCGSCQNQSVFRRVKQDPGHPSMVADELLSLTTDKGLFSILAIDHGQSLLSLLGNDDESDHGPMREAKIAVLELLARRCTAVLVDVPLTGSIGTLWHPPEGVGLIVGLDEFDYDDVECPPPNVPSRELLRELRQAGANAAKVVLYYHPNASDAAARLEAASQVAEQCHVEGLPLLIEPLPLPVAGLGDGAAWPAAEIAEQVAKTGADILKLPLTLGPQTAALASDITKAAAGTPWILLSSGAPYSDFLETLRVALLGGAAGFAAGRSIWGDLVVDVTDDDARRESSLRLEEAAELTRSLGGVHLT